ncbi:hypothetical protein, partial [Pseudoalteromonas piscicida]|uniref:hypothetical protein n=1 Tax=Pseudoalteromonas piscicida TaxID=43662 RepID=UPI001BB0FEA2
HLAAVRNCGEESVIGQGFPLNSGRPHLAYFQIMKSLSATRVGINIMYKLERVKTERRKPQAHFGSSNKSRRQ